MARTVFLEVSVGADVSAEAVEQWVSDQLNVARPLVDRSALVGMEEELDAIDECDDIVEVRRFEPCVGELASTIGGDGAGEIALERARQVNQEGWTREFDDQHTGGQLLAAAAYYCLFVDVFAAGRCFPYGWDKRFKKRQGFPVPTDRDLVKAGALIAAELDRRARERERIGTGDAVSVMVSGQVEFGESPHGVGVISQYSAATEWPEDEV